MKLHNNLEATEGNWSFIYSFIASFVGYLGRFKKAAESKTKYGAWE